MVPRGISLSVAFAEIFEKEFLQKKMAAAAAGPAVKWRAGRRVSDSWRNEENILNLVNSNQIGIVNTLLWYL